MSSKRSILWIIVVMLGLFGTYRAASAATLTLGWADNSDNESGFHIERKTDTAGTYQTLASVGPNVGSYTDSDLSAGTTYCYRVHAFNSVGDSSYSNENCATTSTATFIVSLSRSGTGSGTVASSPAGLAAINCGSACSATLNSGTAVTLTATPASGSVFAGWSGDADCSDGSVTVNSDMHCTATFNVVSEYTLTTSVVNQITSGGSSSGSIVSSPAGINCGTGCTATYASGTIVKLTPVAAPNSTFSSWTGDSDCADGSVTMNANKTCTATFAINLVTLSVSKAGNGTVASTPSGVSCGSACSYSCVVGTTVTLQAIPDAGFTFAGWSGASCTGASSCTLTLSNNTTVMANFSNALSDKIGVYRPSTGEWFLDRNGNDGWDGCGADLCLHPFAGMNGVPVVGDWNGSGLTKVGLFASSQWLLDTNGNGIWDGCASDTCVTSFGQATDVPVVGQWSTAHDDIGIFRVGENKWHLDSNGDGRLKHCNTDRCAALSVYQDGDVPVAGDWTGRGTTQLGLFRPSTGQWFLDSNANGAWNGCSRDLCVTSFGSSGDIPVSGDWNGNGVSKIGVFRSSTGEWFLDLNGNGKWDGASLDLYVPGYGQAGDVPVVGRW